MEGHLTLQRPICSQAKDVISGFSEADLLQLRTKISGVIGKIEAANVKPADDNERLASYKRREKNN